MLEVPDNFFDTPVNRLNVSLSTSGYRLIRDGTFCTGCKLLSEHDEAPEWFICADAQRNPHTEWPAYFVGEDPVACARKEE